MLHDKAAGEQRIFIKAVQEGVAEHIGDLQFGAQHHRENKEDRHTFVFKQREGIKAQHGGPALVFLLIGHRNMRQRQGEEHQQQGERRADIELHMAQFKAGEADAPHGEDKTNGAPDTNRREIGHDIHIRRLQAVVRNGVNQPQRWHIGQRVEQDDEEHFPRRGDLGGEPQRQRADQMANGINPLGADPFIGNDTEQRRHKHRGDTE